MSKANTSERGQAILMFALIFPVVLCALALVIDVGWGHYIGRKAQTAADAAALAAVTKGLQSAGGADSVSCGAVTCQSESECPATGNLQTACQYAIANGFTGAPDSQTVRVAAGAGPNAPGVPDISVDYWVQVRTQESLPQWFSGMFSSFGLRPGARSTAAIRRVEADAALYLLNRSSDCFVSALWIGLVCGEDLLAVGFNTIEAEKPIYMASSNAHGLGLPNVAAANNLGLATVRAPQTYLMGKGGMQTLLLGGIDWQAAPVNGFPDSDYFTDPMAGKGQPPAPRGLPDRPVQGGLIVGSLTGAPTVLPPGNYYSAITLPLVGTIATGLPITITGNVIFSDGQATPCGGFCNYVFYGGLVTGVLSEVTFSPGRYVFAGAQPVSGGPGVGLTVGANGKIKDLTPLVNGEATRNTDAGEILIFTDANFPGLETPLPIRNARLSFPQVRAGILAGLNPQITLHGLNKEHPSVPDELKPFAPALIWQDQANTTLRYTGNGWVDLSCGGPCTKILSIPGSQEMVLPASRNGTGAGVNLYGTIYGPRGSYLTVLGILPGDTIAGPLQIITGALQMALFSNLDLKALPNPPTRLVASLIQ